MVAKKSLIERLRAKQDECARTAVLHPNLDTEPGLAYGMAIGRARGLQDAIDLVEEHVAAERERLRQENMGDDDFH